MVGIKIDAEKATYAFVIDKECRVTVDRELFVRLAEARYPQFPDGAIHRKRVAELPSVWPANGIRQAALDAAPKWFRAEQSTGLEPLSEPEGLEIRGPFKHRRFNAPTTIFTNRSTFSTVGESVDDDLDPGLCDFVLTGKFLERRGRIVETIDKSE